MAPINIDTFGDIAIPAECRAADCTIDLARDIAQGGLWVQHGTVSQHFHDRGDVGPWLVAEHARQLPAVDTDADPSDGDVAGVPA